MRDLLIFFFPLLLACNNTTVNAPADKKENNDEINIEQSLSAIQLPEGYKIEIFADEVENARSMALSPNGTLFIGTRSKGDVYAVQDTDGDYVADKKYTLLTGGNMPNGVAFRDGDLYVAEVNRILKFENIEDNLEAPGEPSVVYDQYPEEKHHGWKFISFGPDGKLYVPVGAPCNICESEDPIFNTITRINADGSDMEIVQSGVRNTVGFTWHPNGDLWFTDNGRDMMGDDVPACELNRAERDQLHFGYPYCHQGDLLDPDLGINKSCDDYTAPVQQLGPHTAPLGVEFAFEDNFDGAHTGNIFIAEHGSWNRSKKIGYRISLVEVDDQFQSKGYSVFASGWLDEEKDEVWGRPVDIEWMPDGSMLVSDDYADVVYRISKKG